jgi:V/A-type H+-transporting ATPase subunit E
MELYMSDSGKLARFISAVNDEIDKKVNDILDGAQKQCDSILAEAESEAEIQGRKLRETNEKRITAKYTRETAQNEFSVKKKLLRHREELTDKLFAEVRDKITALRNQSDYIDVLVKKLLVTAIDNGSEILLAPEDMKFADTLKKAVKAENVTFKPEESIKLGGFSIYNKEKATITDKTFDSAVEEQKAVFVNRNIFA